MRIALTSIVVLAALSAGCGSADREPRGGWAAYPLPPSSAWAPVDDSVGEPAIAADAAAFRAAVEAGLAPALAPRLGQARYLEDVDFEGSRMRVLLAPAGDGGWCLGLRGEPAPVSLPYTNVRPSCLLGAGPEPALAVATLGGPQPEWMSREGGTLVYGRARSDAATVEVELSDHTVVEEGQPRGGTFAIGPFERDRAPLAVIARGADGDELARVELWSEAAWTAVVGTPQQPAATVQTGASCARIGFPLTTSGGSGYGAATFLVEGAGAELIPADPTVTPSLAGVVIFGTLPEGTREIELRFAAGSERHPVSAPCYVVGVEAARLERDGPPISVVAIGEDGEALDTRALRPTWLDFQALP